MKSIVADENCYATNSKRLVCCYSISNSMAGSQKWVLKSFI